MPDRLELIKGSPSLRRAHVDQLVTALWPSRTLTRRAYAQALAQRNALIGRVRAGVSARSSLDAWNTQLATHGIALMQDRERAIALIQEGYARLAAELGLDGDPTLSYRPRSRAESEEQLAAELAERVSGDVERGFTGHGPHRDELALLRDRRELRAYGSQGQQRIALLALLLAEREAIASARSASPLMLLDDVMSELDARRREALVEVLHRGGGQSVITTTDSEHVPGADDALHLDVSDGQVLERVAV
ncbi:MAG: DNA replication and repair protein RecF [Solirubrobacterales bacterium]|nr:DNA replication and repair protein RecF [Solirubrobacterales bacterium]